MIRTKQTHRETADSYHTMPGRRGITTTELVCAALVLSVVATILVPALKAVARQNETSAEHLEVTAAVSNILDTVTAQPYADVTAESLNAVPVPEWLAAQLVEPQLNVEVAEHCGGKQISAELTWQPSRGETRDKVKLQVWIFPGRSA